MPCDKSALVVLVPEAEAVARPFRDRYDPSVAAGVPAHIPLLYPFKAPGEIDELLLGKLPNCFARFAPIQFTLGPIRRFAAELVYLAPEPDEPFRQLTLSIWSLFPETPPYGGKWRDVVPHVSIAAMPDAAKLAAISDDFSKAAQKDLPIPAMASKVALMQSRSGRWNVSTMFHLGTGTA